jgi:hypothetical protein
MITQIIGLTNDWISCIDVYTNNWISYMIDYTNNWISYMIEFYARLSFINNWI